MTEETDTREGLIHPCNGYILVEKAEERTDIIVITDGYSYESAVVVEMSDDETDGTLEVKQDGFEWQKGDLIYFSQSIEVDRRMFVHWTDVVAYKRFADVSLGT